MVPVTRADWKHLPLPEKRARLGVTRVLAEAQMARLRLGVKPSQMEDRWFVFFEDNQLFMHRSWTGYCIYVVSFHPENGGWLITAAEANRDPTQYNQTDDAADARSLAFLMDMLLGHLRGYGDPAIAVELRPMFRWVFFDRGGMERFMKIDHLAKALEALLAVLALDPDCSWREHFNACHAQACALRAKEASQAELAELSRRVREVFGGANSFHDYAPVGYDPHTRQVRVLPGMENVSDLARAVYDAACAMMA